MGKQKLIIYTATIFAFGIGSGLLLATGISQNNVPATKNILDNARVTITELANAPQARREPYTRPTDQIIVFLDPADYETTDAQGTKTRKHRAAGEIIWHNQGEAAPLLINQGNKPYRNLVIALK